VAVDAVTIVAGGMTRHTTYFSIVCAVSLFSLITFLGSNRMTLLAGRAILDIFTACLDGSITMSFRLVMAINAEHPFLVMDIGCAAIFTGKFGINTTTMTKRAGFCFIPPDKLMAFD